ncbi:MAG TPA: M14 metallopeptidase family protein [Longimicrobiales bacterium]|nr:M14 metallopeptidase family protein [Longimicrobiales bacterium]
MKLPRFIAVARRAGARRALFILAVALALPLAAAAQSIPTPEEFFGFQMGADQKLARWDRMVEYYRLLDQASDRIQVVDMGKSTLGNPFLAVWVSAPENMARLSEIQAMNAVLQDPRGKSQAEIERAIASGKVVFVQSYGLHASEVAASQTAVELLYEMATRNDPQMTEILANTVSILIPCFNPDGLIMVTDWNEKTVGTEYEGMGTPSLYHHYIGHDNNRDAFMQNTVESQYAAKIIFREWTPQGYIDHHQMGGYGPRIYLPPYAEPIRPEADPIVWREMSWYGAHMAYKMEEKDLPGSVNAAIYSGWGHFGFHWITPFHNIAGMLTESASPRLASPLYVHPDQLQGSRQLPEYAAQTTFPNPWMGGWWRLRDLVERQKVASYAPLEIAAKNRETVLRNAYLKASRQTERGLEGDTKAFVIPAEQHDPLTAQKMVNKLLGQGVTVERSEAGFTHEGRVYGPGTFVVSMAQPKRGVIRWLLGRTFYPDNSYTRDAQGNPIRPYDMSTDNMAEFMGARVDPVGTPVPAPLTAIGTWLEPRGTVAKGSHGYLLEGRLNDAFRAMNLLWNEGVDARRLTTRHGTHLAGDFWIPDAPEALVARVASETGVTFHAMDVDPGAAAAPVARLRVGMYQRYYGGNMDEGWTRLLLEQFDFPYTSLFDPELKAGSLNRKYDVILIPEDNLATLKGGDRDADEPDYPPEYRSGFGDQGVGALKAFVEAGGTLVTFSRAGDLAIEGLGVPVRNVVAGLPGRTFWSPGSTLRVKVDTTDPYAYGMPENALATFLSGGQVYETVASAKNEAVRRLVTYVDRDVLHSGWLLGEEHIAGKAAVVSVERGKGRVLLIGFRAQHRAQTHGTFKLLFNALVGAPPAR